MAKGTGTEQWVILPPRGLRARARTITSEAQEFLRSAHRTKGAAPGGDGEVPLRVVDSIAPDGAKLVELTPQDALGLRARFPGLRLVPVVHYTHAVVAREQATTPPEATGEAVAPGDVTLQVVSRKGRAPVAGAFVVAWMDYANRVGAQGVTDGEGKVTLSLGEPSIVLERLYVYPVDTYWSIIKKRFAARTGARVALTPLELGYTDGLRHFYGDADLEVGAGVTVGVVDTGVAEHPDLVIAGGANTVPGEDPGDFGDNGRAHGTHVAGIIAARGTPPTGLRGVAPGVSLRSYRVFGEGQSSAGNYAIAKGIEQAVADKCDLINISFGGTRPDPLLQAAIDDARAAGSVVIVASGNGDRGPVAFPANEPMAVAVTAMGRKRTFPSNAAASDEVAAPFGTDKANFLALVSNVGPEVDLTAPGVGIMSTVPGGYGEISGTAMACAAATGAAARAIAGTEIVSMRRDAARSEAILKALLASAMSLGFGPESEGHGLPLP